MITKRARKRVAKPEESRLYVVVAEKIYVKDRAVYLEGGRQAAQACHVTGKYRAQSGNSSDITTIILEARSDRELMFLGTAMAGRSDLYSFQDHNPEFYGTKDRVLTAICLGPIPPSKARELVGHLELL